VNNLGSKPKIRLTGALGNLLLFRSMGRGTRESLQRKIYRNLHSHHVNKPTKISR
jgi:hypothetical protein